MSTRPPAAAPAARRTIDVVLGASHPGWEAQCYADFSFGTLADLNSSDPDRIIAALDKIVITHNFPELEAPERVATSISDVDSGALQAFVEALGEELGRLPNATGRR